MNLKALSLNFILMAGVAILTALLMLLGNNYLNKKEDVQDEGASFSLFGSSPEKEPELHFVEIKNLVITLKSNTDKEHYMLLDLALTTHDETMSKKAEKYLPKIKGFTVDIFSVIDYSEVRRMSVEDLRKLMMEYYREAFKKLEILIPFEDVTFAKMVFQ